MALRKIFCPFCGQATQVNDSKEFCFCLECGNKIQLQPSKEAEQIHNLLQTQSTANPSPREKDVIQETSSIEMSVLDEKLREVEFYYSLSNEKQEYMNFDAEPIYFLKAQDLLIDLSQQYPNDYRIWWELCKPLDFQAPLSGADVNGQFIINQRYFSKALDLATLEQKKALIDAHDKYLADKKAYFAELEKKREEDIAERKRIEEEEAARRREEQENRQKEIRKQREEQAQRVQEERKRQQELRQQGITQSELLWNALANKDYSSIDACFFQFSAGGNQTIIGIFRVVSNVLYLMSFRIDHSKNNALLRDQTLTIKFDAKGVAYKFDNKPVRIKGMMPPYDMIHIVNNGRGGYSVNDMPLNRNIEYVNNIMKNSKKPLISFNKTFL